MRKGHARFFQGALVLASLFLGACDEATTTTTPSPATASVLSSMGTDFYVTLPDHLCTTSPGLCNNVPVTNKLIVAAATGTTGEVTFNGVVTPFTVAAGNQAVIALDPTVVLTLNETAEAKAIRVTSVAPVSVHVVSETATSADGYLALPTAALGTHYYVMSYASGKYPGSQFAVVATQDNTSINITPAAAGATKLAGAPFTVVLNSGETYQFANPGLVDMTGTLVSADKPVGVFSGHRCTEVPINVGFCDYLVEQIPDTSVWGTVHHTVPFSGRMRYTVRVLASQDGTIVDTTAGSLGPLNAGQHADVILSGIGEFISDKPVLVAQFMHGYTDDVAGKGDPSMVLVTPTAADPGYIGVMDSIFAVHGLDGTAGVLLNVVTETAELGNLKLDNLPVMQSLFTPISPTSAYSAGTIPVTPGVHTLSGAVPYSALAYDFGIVFNSVSYAYPVGATLIRPVISAPAPADPVPAPTDPLPVLTDPTVPTVPTDPAPAPVDPAPAPVDPAPAPVDPAPAPVDPAPAPVDPAPVPVDPAPAPTDPAPAPTDPTAAPTSPPSTVCADGHDGSRGESRRHHNHTIHGNQANGQADQDRGHDSHDELHTGEHPHQHAHDRSHDGAHDHSHHDGEAHHEDDPGCHQG